MTIKHKWQILSVCPSGDINKGVYNKCWCGKKIEEYQQRKVLTAKTILGVIAIWIFNKWEVK